MKNYWLIRSGTEGAYLRSFLEHKCVSIDFGVGDLSGANSREDIYKIYKEAYPDAAGRGTGCKGSVILATVRRLADDEKVERKILHDNAKKLFKL